VKADMIWPFVVDDGAIGYACAANAASTVVAITSTYGGFIASPTSTGGSAATGTPSATAAVASTGFKPYVIGIIIISVVYGLWYFSALVILIMCCLRHRKFMDQLDNQAYLQTQAEIMHYHQQASMLSPQLGGGFQQQPIMMGTPGPGGYRGLESQDGNSPVHGNVTSPPAPGESPVHGEKYYPVVEPPQPPGTPAYYNMPQGPSPVHQFAGQQQQQHYPQPGTMY
jgi:hypothetical protein